MKERRPTEFQNNLLQTSSQEVVAVLQGMKHTAFLIKMVCANGLVSEYLFRFEDGVSLTLDPRVPKPQELYRDIAFHRMDTLLGWGVTAPVEKWEFESMKGVIRPYYKAVKTLSHYQIKQYVNPNDFLLKTAILDYICAVVDRNSNDILIVDSTPFLIDSGISFVDGINFVYQNSQIRDVFIGEKIPQNLLETLSMLNYADILNITYPYLDKCQIHQVLERSRKLLEKGDVI